MTDGLLTIHADNSTFSDVLAAVQRATGATVEVPSPSSERVFFSGGPGEPRDVMAALLNGSPYDYILLGSAQEPQALTRIMLTVRKTTPVTAAASSPARPLPAPKPEVDTTSSETPEPAFPNRPVGLNQGPPQQPNPNQPGQETNMPAQPPGTPQPGTPPGATQPGTSSQPGQMPGQPAAPGQVKTPEQMLQELQKLQQQQQQQLQLQNQLNQQNSFSR
jgi:hypothetical protein